MKISEKQIYKLMDVAYHYIELIALIQMSDMHMNDPDTLQETTINLLREINNQQSEELKEIG